METLPVEMVEMIVRQLTPQDLARCSTVCREWREIFNQDCMWKPHCDPELEEPLRTIPCVATPAFVAPEAENPTLSPISPWKLAFMRENHLWKNWRSNELLDGDENVTTCDKNDMEDVDFLTDTLVVVWYLNRIEILDVSHVPTALVAKTDNSVDIIPWYKCSVVGTTMLLLATEHLIQVFSVDIHNKTIKLKHTISVISYRGDDFIVVQEHIFLCFTNENSKLKIFDLNTGSMLKEEQCPVNITQNESVSFTKMRSSPTSDFVACQVAWRDGMQDFKCYAKYYIYSLEQLAFLPGPVAKYEDDSCYFALQGHWLATADSKTIKFCNFLTGDVLLSHISHNSNPNAIPLSFKLEVSNDCFVWVDFEDVSKYNLKLFFPSNRTLSTLCEISKPPLLRIINNKFITISHGRCGFLDSVWKPSGQMVECGISVRYGCKFNRSFTKVLYDNVMMDTLDINCLW